jgi:hypothetical protein
MLALAHSIVTLAGFQHQRHGSSKQLDMKQRAKFLYSMAVLNFSDPVLVSRICSDVETGLGSTRQTKL